MVYDQDSLLSPWKVGVAINMYSGCTGLIVKRSTGKIDRDLSFSHYLWKNDGLAVKLAAPTSSQTTHDHRLNIFETEEFMQSKQNTRIGVLWFNDYEFNKAAYSYDPNTFDIKMS
jgi:hypothetical protein